MFYFGFFDSIIKTVAQEAAHQLAEVGGDLARQAGSQAMGSVIEVGKQELGKGVESLKASMQLDALKNNPEKLCNRITQMARMSNGELTIAQVIAEFPLDEAYPRRAFGLLIGKGLCFPRELEEGGSLYIFPGFKKKQPVKLCEYCGNRFKPEDAPKNDCPSCGAPLVSSMEIV